MNRINPNLNCANIFVNMINSIYVLIFVDNLYKWFNFSINMILTHDSYKPIKIHIYLPYSVISYPTPP